MAHIQASAYGGDPAARAMHVAEAKRAAKSTLELAPGGFSDGVMANYLILLKNVRA